MTADYMRHPAIVIPFGIGALLSTHVITMQMIVWGTVIGVTPRKKLRKETAERDLSDLLS